MFLISVIIIVIVICVMIIRTTMLSNNVPIHIIIGLRIATISRAVLVRSFVFVLLSSYFRKSPETADRLQTSLFQRQGLGGLLFFLFIMPDLCHGRATKGLRVHWTCSLCGCLSF